MKRRTCFALRRDKKGWINFIRLTTQQSQTICAVKNQPFKKSIAMLGKP